jgi:hypothetical protein
MPRPEVTEVQLICMQLAPSSSGSARDLPRRPQPRLTLASLLATLPLLACIADRARSLTVTRTYGTESTFTCSVAGDAGAGGGWAGDLCAPPSWWGDEPPPKWLQWEWVQRLGTVEQVLEAWVLLQATMGLFGSVLLWVRTALSQIPCLHVVDYAMLA